MANHGADESSHKRVIELHSLRARISSATLYHVPRPEHGHDVVIEVYLRSNDLTASWVGNNVSGGIRPFGRFVHDHRMAGIFNVEIGVFGLVRDFTGHDGILEARR